MIHVLDAYVLVFGEEGRLGNLKKTPKNNQRKTETHCRVYQVPRIYNSIVL